MTHGSLALLITGQVREGQLDFAAMTQSVPPGTEIFASVWSKIGMRVGGWLGPWQIARVLGEAIGSALPPSLIGVDRLALFLPAYFRELHARAGTLDVDGQALERVTSRVDIEDHRLFVERLPGYCAHFGVRFIHYKLARALAMMQLYEKQIGRKFTNVMRIRPDLLEAPEIALDFDDDEIFVDWHDIKADARDLAGDNAVLARREVMLDLCEYLRVSIYEDLAEDVHAIIRKFIAKNGLKARPHFVRFAEDRWPRHEFVQCLQEKVEADPGDATACEFLACIRANDEIQRSDLSGAAARLAALGQSRSLPVMLCRGRLALAEGRLEDVDAEICRLKQAATPGSPPGHDYYAQRLDQLRAEYTSTRPGRSSPTPREDVPFTSPCLAFAEEISSEEPETRQDETLLSAGRSVESRRVRAGQLRQLLSVLQEKLRDSEDASSAWLDLSGEDIYGIGLRFGNYRRYRLAHYYWTCTVYNFTAAILRFRAETGLEINHPETFQVEVVSTEVSPGTTPHVERIYDAEGKALDPDRQLQHCIIYEQHSRAHRAMRAYMDGIQAELELIERENGLVAA